MWHAGRSHGRMTLKCGPSHGVMPLPCDRRLRLLQCITFGSDGGNTLKRPLQKLAGKWRSRLTTAAFCHRVTPFWRIAYPLVLLRARRLCKREGFEPAEAFRLGLFQPRSRRHRHVKYVSRRRLTKVQESLNPVAWAPLLMGKDLFYRYCMAVEAPIPRLYAIIHAKLPGWTYTGHLLRTRNDWMAFFDNNLPAEFVVKPAEGACGQGPNLFRRSDKGYVNAAGKHMETGDLYDLLVPHATAGYIIQERLHNHPELIRLGGTETLQTVRIITLVDNDGQVHILHAHLKIIEADGVIDPLIHELTGNIEAPVELRHGTLRAANRIPGTGAAVMTIPAHPKTKIAFEGLRLPFWAEACHLVRQTAVKFIPIRTIGWDVALTPDGPVIVEGNVWWDPPNQHGDMGEILRALSEPSLPRTPQSERAAEERSPWSSLFAEDRKP